jgi:hypothetical protein
LGKDSDAQVAKKTRKERKNGDGESWVAICLKRAKVWAMGAQGDPPSRGSMLVQFLGVSAGLVILACIGLSKLDLHVRSLPNVVRGPQRVTLYQRPAWMSPGLADEIVNNVAGPILDMLTSRPEVSADSTVPQHIAEKFAQNGWVRRVAWVHCRSGGQVEVNCEFREPTAIIAAGQWRHLIDAEGYVLPGLYSPEALAECGFVEIRGYAGRIPAANRRWESDDVQDALNLAVLLRPMHYANQVRAIDISNHNGRLHPRACWIVLITDRDTVIRWGRPPGKEGGLEITPQQKLALLAGVYRDYGHIDCGRSSIGIRWSPQEVDVSVAAAASGSQ